MSYQVVIYFRYNSTGKNMAESPKTRHFIPAIIFPSKVVLNSSSQLDHYIYLCMNFLLQNPHIFRLLSDNCWRQSVHYCQFLSYEAILRQPSLRAEHLPWASPCVRHDAVFVGHIRHWFADVPSFSYFRGGLLGWLPEDKVST